MDPQLLIVNNKMHLICPILHLFYAASQQSNPGFRRAAAPRAALHAAAQRRGLLAATERSRVASRRPLTPLFRALPLAGARVYHQYSFILETRTEDQ
jgi:hypothetical protein